MRRIVDFLYYWSARLMPMQIDRWFGGTFAGVYVMSARFYFECRDNGTLDGWPWRWQVEIPDTR